MLDYVLVNMHTKNYGQRLQNGFSPSDNITILIYTIHNRLPLESKDTTIIGKVLLLNFYYIDMHAI